MKILVITKRQYTNKDLLDDKYGRLREIPLALAERGHQVHGLCFSYRPRPDGVTVDRSLINSATVIWESISPGKFVIDGIYKYIAALKHKIEKLKPDFIWASSDCLHIIGGANAGRYYNVPCISDLYDNYESFGLSKIPFVLPRFRKEIARSNAYTCVSTALARYIRHTCSTTNPYTVIENAVDTHLFKPLDIKLCRQFFSLPLNASIIGTAGALEEGRGIQTLYKAFGQLILSNPKLHLLLAGTVDKHRDFPKGENIHYLGQIAYEHIPKFIASLNVGIICNIDSDFGRYNFPQKAYEMISCKIPIVAANVGSMGELLKGTPKLLFEPKNVASLAETITNQINTPYILQCYVPNWKSQAIKLEKLAEDILN